MRISIFGLGYVGCVSAACVSSSGHRVIGVDPNEVKVNQINEASSPIIENDLGDLIHQSVSKGLLSATTSGREAILDSDVSFICVGTPSQVNGDLDLEYICNVCEEIGKSIHLKDSFHLVVVRSTMLPGSMRDVVIPILEESSGKVVGKDFGVCINPEFLREGTAVYDFFHPPKIVIGEIDDESGSLLVKLYENINSPLLRTDLRTAEMVKYTDNVWHALKVCFANEIGNFCKELDIDSHQVMDIFCQDKKLNLSSYYLKPGFAFGGSCLPKDVRAFSYKAKTMDLDLPIITSILPNNNLQIQRGLDMILKEGKKKIAILGFSFKAGTDDLRESPIVEIIERLLGKGYDLCLYDHNVHLASLTGANKDYILNVIPHISELMVDNIGAAINDAEVIVIGNNSPEFNDILEKTNQDQVVIDFTRISSSRSIPDRYNGISW